MRLAAAVPFGFGASSLGNLYAELSDEAAREAVDTAWSLGVRYFDTAPYYGFGLSERRLGDALRGHDRDSYLISTKAGRLLVPTRAAGERCGFHSPMPFAATFDYSYDGVMRSFEASLHRLGLARIDILLLHDLGALTHGAGHSYHFSQAVRGGFRALEELRSQRLVSAIGLGVNEVGVCVESMCHADFDLFLIAGRFTLLDQSAARFIEACSLRGIGILAGGVFNSGVLADGASGDRVFYDYLPVTGPVRQRLEAIERICQDFDVALPAAALQFAASHPGVTLPLVGMRSSHEVVAACEHWAAQIPGAFWNTLGASGLIEHDLVTALAAGSAS